MNRKHLKPKD